MAALGDEQRRHDDEAPGGFIEECGEVPLAVGAYEYRYGKALLPGLGGDGAVGLLVDEIAPAPDGLAQGDGGRGQVGQPQEGQPLAPGVQPARQHAADDAAVDGHAALPDVQRPDGIGGVFPPREQHIVEPGAHDGRGNADQRKVQRRVPGQVQAPFPRPGQRHGQGHADGDDHAVPVKDQPEEDDARGCELNHGSLLKQ